MGSWARGCRGHPIRLHDFRFLFTELCLYLARQNIGHLSRYIFMFLRIFIKGAHEGTVFLFCHCIVCLSLIMLIKNTPTAAGSVAFSHLWYTLNFLEVSHGGDFLQRHRRLRRVLRWKGIAGFSCLRQAGDRVRSSGQLVFRQTGFSCVRVVQDRESDEN